MIDKINFLILFQTFSTGATVIPILLFTLFKTRDNIIKYFLLFFFNFTIHVFISIILQFFYKRIDFNLIIASIILRIIFSYTLLYTFFIFLNMPFNIHKKLKNKFESIIIFLILIFMFVFDLLFLKFDYVNKKIEYVDQFIYFGLSITEILFLIIYLYNCINGIINLKKILDKEKKIFIRNLLIMALIFVPLIMLDLMYPKVKYIYFSPFLYSIMGIIAVFYIIKIYFIKQDVDPVILNENIIQKYNISNREREIIQLILKGYSNKDICELLYISLNTIKTHNKNIFQKMGIKSRYELIAMLKM